MSVRSAAVIAEYNPFHNGHLYHLRETRRRTGAAHIVVLLSGHFTQRGEAAVLSPHVRAEACLRCGADAVFLIPAPFSAAAAGDYAAYGVSLASSLGIGALSFGTEGADISSIRQAADLLSAEDSPGSGFSESLKQNLRNGMTYPEAREEAAASSSGMDRSYFHALLSAPNQLLGIEYAAAAKKYAPDMELTAIPRKGAPHNSCLIPEDRHIAGNDSGSAGLSDSAGFSGPGPLIVSAGTLRREFFKAANENASSGGMDRWAPYIPPEAASVFEKEAPLSPEAFRLPVRMRLLTLLLEGRPLSSFADFPEALEPRLRELLLTGTEPLSVLDDLTEKLHMRQFTKGRIRRALLRAFLGITAEEMAEYRQALPGFAYLLGFRKDSKDLLSELKKDARIPIIVKAADAEKILGSGTTAFRLFSSEAKAAAYWNMVRESVTGIRSANFYRRSPVVV